MNRAMGSQNESNEEKDAQDLIIESMRSRKMRSNASYLAFTATPKPNTIEKFGTPKADGKMGEFDLYSMKQAIEEGFILDVLNNYNTNKSYYEIHKSISENPLFDTSKAQKALKAFVEKNPKTIQVKAEIMVDHFIKNVVNKKKLKGKAKGMVLTQSIEISDKLARYFDMDDYRILIVANKFLTGFDQPKLVASYVDKKLQGVLAVQALSRLNRSAPKYGKKTEDLSVIDFFNSTEEIKKSFDPFYTSTTLSGPTDVNVLHELKDNLDAPGVYEWSEVEQFNELFFKGTDAQDLSPIVGVAAERFNTELDFDDKEKADYKIKTKQFVKIYGQMASIMPFEVVRWEKLFWFAKFLIPKLIIRNPEDDALDELLNAIDLSTYGLERTKIGTSIGLDDSETEVDPQNPNPRGAHGGEEEVDELDLIVKSFNERWFQGWEATPEEQRVKFVNFASQMRNHADYETKYANNPDQQNREIAIAKIFEEVARKQRKNDMSMYRLLAQDEAFKQAMLDTMKRMLND